MDRYIDTKYLMDYFAQDQDYYGPYVRADIEDNMPAIDIVHCEECKHYHVEKYHTYCDVLNIRGKLPPDPEPDDFCSYGEREERQRLEGKNYTAALTMKEARNVIDILSWELEKSLWKPWGIVASPLLIHELMSEAIDHRMEIRMEADGTDTIFGLVIIPCEICENDKVHIVDEKTGRALLAGRKGGSNGREYGKDQM